MVINTTYNEARKRYSDTFFSFDWYSVLTKDLKKALGQNGIIDLNDTQLSVSMSQFTGKGKYPKGTLLPYVLCTDEVKFNDTCVEQVLFSSKTGYYLYRIIDPAFLDVDYIKDYYEE